jgi:hypothetical protein
MAVKRKSKRTKRKKINHRVRKTDQWGDRIAWFFLVVLWIIFLSYFFSGDYVGKESNYSPTVENYMLFALFGILAVATTLFLGLSWRKSKGGSPNPGKKNR